MRALLPLVTIAIAAACGTESVGTDESAGRGGAPGRGGATAGQAAGRSSADAGASASGGRAGASGAAGDSASAGRRAAGGGTASGGESGAGSSGEGGEPSGGTTSGGTSSGGTSSGGASSGGTSGGGPLEGETIGSYAELDLQAHAVYTVDLGLGDYPVFLTESATADDEPGAGWNGEVAVHVTPPLAGGYGALGSFGNLWKDGSFTIRKLNFRFEVQFGATFGEHWPNDDLKFVIVHTADSLGAETNERPMCNWANASAEGSGILAWAVGAGTVKNFSPPGLEPAYSPSGNEEFYLGPSAGEFNGKRMVGPQEWISIEVEVIAEATTEAPEGRIRSVLTLRDGTELTELEIPWTYDSNWELPSFISEVQVIGGYYNTGTTAAAPDNFYRIADHITFAANRPGLLGPRAGFVQL
jgi:hypothetical protein